MALAVRSSMLLVASAALLIGGARIALALALRSRHVRCICFCVLVALNLRAYHPAPLARAHAQIEGGRVDQMDPTVSRSPTLVAMAAGRGGSPRAGPAPAARLNRCVSSTPHRCRYLRKTGTVRRL